MWTITKDTTAEPNSKPGTNTNAVGMVGPKFVVTHTHLQIVNHPEAKKFRMKDDDDNVYYEGVAVMGKFHTGFEPLDDFGAPNAGCTSIEYWDRGHWETL